ncbi:hypothetical protein HYH02_009816 [Chlamydomonas schloesseri]|uniref:Heat shock factor binding protein n=1 Tax=Chlamydomonas schloesseri TaxID=2026947 RepID=A0A835TK63_9CHLO|nr:hypothetical protein HYH02_009816 [Chlamydomonas schloesseri]|eukprot:KAG2442024.1 hypothetical protein HYH02_009816 [Chlamydomonas schloesseri]
MADKSSDSSAELTNFVQGLLQQMSARFQVMSDNIVHKIDDMGTKIDNLEATIAELLEQAGQEQQQPVAGGKEHS